jgi:hypothetical protein
MKRLLHHCDAFSVRELIAALCVVMLVIVLWPMWVNQRRTAKKRRMFRVGSRFRPSTPPVSV